HPQLKKDCLVIGRFPLCHLLLMQDANYPWFILVPDREAITEIHQLDANDREQLLRESCALASVLTERFKADKLNIATLGNVVPQLHVHHVVRYRDDPAWPAPVWGCVPPRPYSALALAEVFTKLRAGAPDGLEILV
ncbi:MAG: HIT domain-containing protein, partial [Gammaproteobacteria bacterium]|nr:HIT domain-containing protein [Gammaproteobacteria bacterium]